MSAAKDDYPLVTPRTTESWYGAAMAEIDRLRAECQLQRNLLGNATGAAIDVGLTGDVTAHDAIYLLAAERDALRVALVKWDRGQLSPGWGRVDEELASLIPADDWGLGVTGGEPE